MTDYSLKNRKPIATATISGSDQMPNLTGNVNFYAAPDGGTLVSAQVEGLPCFSSTT